MPGSPPKGGYILPAVISKSDKLFQPERAVSYFFAIHFCNTKSGILIGGEYKPE
jgi:hypothetical protein